ncbi:unnamed protein product [Ambrosiozyma monospora]|uniref:Unnamed protein product n=1 Tax=Ambrosiozyma monospora TaxID=43982 RepID=A0ACB5T0L6_AMBMO|nr:unnamed protein product [Ambrosiozyma monospora]
MVLDQEQQQQQSDSHPQPAVCKQEQAVPTSLTEAPEMKSEQQQDNTAEEGSSLKTTKKVEFKTTKKNSKTACEECKSRKVKCDVVSKEKGHNCTNCETLGLKCVVVKQRRKRRQSAVDRQLKIIEQQKEEEERLRLEREKQRLLQQSQEQQQAFKKESPTSVPSSSGPSDIKFYQQRPFEEELEHKDPFSELKGDEMYVDLGRFLSHEIDPTQVAELSRVLNSPFGLKRFMEDYYKNQGKITVRDLATRESIKVLTSSGCFILPSAEKCQRYTEMFFKVFYVSYPLLAKQSFMSKNTGDRYSDPQSLLLLRSVIYMGCAHCAETEEEKNECKILYEKAMLLLSANLESNGICLVSSMIILMCAPEVRLSLETPVDELYRVIQVARLFGMDRDVEKSTRLSQEDKALYKILFWMLVFKDRLHSLVSAKDYFMDISDCNVKMLVPEDFTQLRMENPEYSYKVFSWTAAMGHLMDKVTELQKKANIAALKCQPFMSYVNDINGFIEEFFVAIINAHDMYSNLYGQQWLSLMYLFVMSLSLNIQRANLARLYIVCERAIQNETVTKGSSLYLELELEELCEMRCREYLQQTAHILCYFVAGLMLKFKNQLFFSQSTLYLCYQSAICAIPFLFDPDEDIRKTTAQDLERIIPVLNQAKSFNTWQITEFFSFILNDIVPDENKLVNFARSAFNVNGVEKLWKAAEGPNFKLIRTIMEKNLPPLRSPFMKVPNLSVNTPNKDSADVTFSLDDEGFQSMSKLFVDPYFDFMKDTLGVQLGDSRTYNDLLIGINKHEKDACSLDFLHQQLTNTSQLQAKILLTTHHPWNPRSKPRSVQRLEHQ